MNRSGKRWGESFAPKCRNWWRVHGPTVLRIGLVLMAVGALGRLQYELPRLLWEPGPLGAIDLKYVEVHRWFAGLPVYGVVDTAVYPPASYAILWPLLGWLALTPARWLWAATALLALAWLASLTARAIGAHGIEEHTFVALFLLSMYATNVTIGNGQLIVHALPALIAGLCMFHQKRVRWRTDLLAAAFLLVALVKPTVSVPFMWIVLFVPGRLRPAVLVSGGYLALTLIASLFQKPPISSLLHDWIVYGLEPSQYARWWSHSNLHRWLTALGLEEWNLFATLLMLTALGVWTYRNRHQDFWFLLGVTALVARFWTYHALYDAFGEDSCLLVTVVVARGRSL